MATVPIDVDDIQPQMAAIRHDLHEDVKDVAATAAAATDWRRYFTAYPWVTLGLAFGLGYYLVPRRHRSAEALATTQADLSKVRQFVESTGKQATESIEARNEPAKERRKSLLAAGLGMLAPLLLKTAQGYALKYIEHWIMQQQTATHQAGPRPVHPGGMGPGHSSADTRRGGGPGAG